MFDKITVIGCGLIGSSLLRAISKKKLSKQINAFDNSKEVTSYLKQNLSINVLNDLNESVKDSDLIIISTPLSSYKEVLLSINSNLKKDVILTDTGSAKKEINKIISNFNLKDVNWIASHPIAGTEKSGPEAGYADLFQNRWCIITPISGNSKKNNLSKLGDLNFWVDSKAYNHVENVHQIWLLSLVDLIIGKSKYLTNL